MSDQAVLLPKLFSYWGIILAKEQLDHSYTYWIMPIMIFRRVYFFLVHPLVCANWFHSLIYWIYSLKINKYEHFENIFFFYWKQFTYSTFTSIPPYMKYRMNIFFSKRKNVQWNHETLEKLNYRKSHLLKEGFRMEGTLDFDSLDIGTSFYP
jgi:hypothetical protein